MRSHTPAVRRLARTILPLPVLGLLALATSGAFLSAHAQTSPPHVMVIVEENAAESSADGTPYIIGNTKAPYLNQLAGTNVSATSWFSVQHTSQYAYRDLIAGKGYIGQKAPFGDPTLVDELVNAGYTWKAYMESAPSSTCAGDTKSSGNYQAGHNPFVSFKSILNSPSQCAQVVPYSQLGLNTDLNGPNPPDFAWITPNLCDDMHSTCTSNKVAQGDTWLKNNLPTVLNSAWYAAGGVVIITWDESASGDSSGGSFGTGGHIATLVISNNNTGGHFTASGDHYGTLRGIEEAYGLSGSQLLGNSSNPSFGDLLPAF